MNIDRFSHFIKKEIDRKIRNTVCNLVILLFAISILSGFTTQNVVVFGQSNQTSSSDKDDGNVIQSSPDANKAESKNTNNQDINEQLTSNNTTSSSTSSSSNNSEKDDSNNNQQQKTKNGLTQPTSSSSSTSTTSTTSAKGNPSPSKPDRECLFDPSMPKCAPDENGRCPEGYNMNEDGQCFPSGGCPNGFYRADDDETGRCIPNSNGCPTDMIFRPDMKSCGYKDDVCSQYPELKACQTNNDGKGHEDEKTKKAAYDSGYSHGCSDAKIPNDSQRYISQQGKGPLYHTSDFMDRYYQGFDYCSTKANSSNNVPYESGYQHGCNDAKIDDVSKRYINQLGAGPAYHTNEFMRGYYDGFDVCSGSNNSGPSTNEKGTFKTNVEVTNKSPKDLTGEITVNVDHQPENIVKNAYGLYFPGNGKMISKTFTFKSSDVPVGTGFDVTVSYWDGINNHNQHKSGINSPDLRTEVVQFIIP